MAWHYLIAQADEHCAEGRAFGTRENVLRAIEIYHRALGLVGRERLPLEWAATQHHLGGALMLLGDSDHDTGPLREAVDVYLAALEEWTLERAPTDWTKAQVDLGDALHSLANRKATRSDCARRPKPIVLHSRNTPGKLRRLNGLAFTIALATRLRF
jgi:hypothetical protein